MDEKKNPLTNYNTEAYRPENDGLGQDAGEDGANTQSAGLAQNANSFENGGAGQMQYTSQTRGEALQGTSTASADSISTLSQKSPETLGNGVSGQNGVFGGFETSGAGNANARMQNVSMSQSVGQNGNLEKHKKRGKTITVIAILATALILGIAIAVAWWMIDGSKANEQKPGDAGQGGVVVEPEDEVIALDVNDELVQGLYGNFRNFPGIQGYGYRAFYDIMNGDDDERKEMAKIVQVIAHTEPVDCKMASEGADYNAMGFCVDGDVVAEEFRNTYGYDITHRDVSGYGFCGGTHYFAEQNQYFNGTACGGSGPSTLKKWLYKAESDGDHIYIYDLAEVWAAVFADSIPEGEDGIVFVKNIHCHTNTVCPELESELVGADLMDIPSDVVLVSEKDKGSYEGIATEVNFAEYADKLDIYKWTFTKTEDGNYVFESLERVEE